MCHSDIVCLLENYVGWFSFWKMCFCTYYYLLQCGFKLTCSNGIGIYISTQQIFLSFVLASIFKVSAISFTFPNDILSSSSSLLSLVDIINRSQYLTLHTLEVHALIPDGSICSPRIRLTTLDFPEPVSPNDEKYICYNCSNHHLIILLLKYIRV